MTEKRMKQTHRWVKRKTKTVKAVSSSPSQMAVARKVGLRQFNSEKATQRRRQHYNF